MGRPLKIQQYNTAQAVAIDQGFPQFANLDPTTSVVPTGMTTTQYLGVTGGGYNGGIASTTFPIVQIRANVNGTAGNAYIITQKGSSKYLVAATNTVNDGSFVAGNSYIIKTLGNTAWSTIGGIVGPAVGEVFTAITTGSSANTGTASDVGQCAMVANATITAGQMSISFNSDGNAIYASRLTNKYIFDGSTPPNRYAVNFFVAGENSTVALSNVAIANTAGGFTSNAANITVNQVVTISGTLTGSGTISGYANPTNYYVIGTNNANAFILSTTAGGANIVTTAGNTRGLTISLSESTTVKSGAEADTWTNATGNITLAQVNKYTA